MPERKRATIEEQLAEVNGVVTPSELDSEALKLGIWSDDCERRELYVFLPMVAIKSQCGALTYAIPSPTRQERHRESRVSILQDLESICDPLPLSKF